MPSSLHASKALLSETLAPPPAGPELRIGVSETPAFAEGPVGASAGDDAFDDAPRHRWWRRTSFRFFLLILLPTALVAAFEYGVAADQFVSEAHFIVRGQQAGGNASGLGQLLGLNPTPVVADAHSVGDYLLSHDAVAALQARLDLKRIFRRPEADPFTRLWSPDPPDETLLTYYRDKVHASYSPDTGITTFTVRTFRPNDSKALADALLELSEARVNVMNARMLRDGLASAGRQVAEAEKLVERAQVRLTAFRQARRDADPERSSSALIQLAAALQERAAEARARYEAMAAALPRGAPQLGASARTVAALERQASSARAGLAGSQTSLAAGLGQYEELQMRRELAAKRFEAAQASYQSAREQLLKQQLFIVPVVEPNLPQKALYPKRLTIIACVFFGLLLACALGWLILAGVREHAS